MRPILQSDKGPGIQWTPVKHLLWIAALCLLSPVSTAWAQEGKRVALIIGNDAYAGHPLRNAVNDARAIDKALRGAGFKTILKENATKTMMEEALVEFIGQLGPDDTALFYYAGHGVQIADENFLVPVDFKAASSVVAAKFLCLSFPRIVDELKSTRVKKTILVLDACRSNPLGEGQASQGGLANPPNLGGETFISFSTSPNHVAADNPNGRNSYFSEALSDLIGQPGLTIEEVFRRVGGRVEAETEKRQTPWVQSSLTTRFYFHAPDNAAEADNDPALAEKWMEDSRVKEQREDWDQAIDLVQQVISAKTPGNIGLQARRKLAYLTARRDAQLRFDGGDYAAAAKLFEQALALDPFSIDAAFLAARSYLLNDQLTDSVRVLQAARLRGATASVDRSNAMLKELAAVSKEAAAELSSGARKPPPIDEMFADVHFLTPDLEAGDRYLQSNRADISGRVQELFDSHKPVDPAALPSVSLDALHVEVISSTRDLNIRKTGERDSGFIELNGLDASTPVLVDGKPIGGPGGKLQLPTGGYQVRLVKQGAVVGTPQSVEVTPNGVSMVVLK